MVESVKDRVVPAQTKAVPTMSTIQKNQELAGWRRWVKAVEYVGFVGGERSQTSKERVAEVDKLIEDATELRTARRFRTAQPNAALATYKIEHEDNEEVTEDMPTLQEEGQSLPVQTRSLWKQPLQGIWKHKKNKGTSTGRKDQGSSMT